MSKLAVGPLGLLHIGYPSSFSGVEQLGTEFDHSPLPSAKVKNQWSYASSSSYDVITYRRIFLYHFTRFCVCILSVRACVMMTT